MKRDLVRKQRGDVKPVEKLPPIEPRAARSFGGGWISFTYSQREISSVGGKTHVRSREYRFENGKLEAETFEGTLGGAAYGQAIEQAQKLVAAQTNAFLSFFSAFLPPASKDK
jgi:hypothetical protein